MNSEEKKLKLYNEKMEEKDVVKKNEFYEKIGELINFISRIFHQDIDYLDKLQKETVPCKNKCNNVIYGNNL